MSRTTESSFRVYYFDDSLIKSWRAARDKQRATNLSFIAAATDTHLAVITKELRAVGLTGEVGKRRPVRLELPLGTLAALSEASEQTGISTSTLLGICLGRASAKKSRRGGKTA